MFPRFSDVQSLIDPLLYLTGLVDVSGALEGHRLEDDEPICFPAALSESSEFLGQSLDKAAHDSPAWKVIPPRGHHLQFSPESMPRLVVFDLLPQVRSIIGLHPVPIYLPDPPFLHCGNVPWYIPRGPLPVLGLICISPRLRCYCFDQFPLLY